jgi:hypothetical protein
MVHYEIPNEYQSKCNANTKYNNKIVFFGTIDTIESALSEFT